MWDSIGARTVTRVYGPRYPEGAREPTVPPDNGEMHYGVGIRGSICGVEDPNRRETAYEWTGVTCPACRKVGRFRGAIIGK